MKVVVICSCGHPHAYEIVQEAPIINFESIKTGLAIWFEEACEFVANAKDLVTDWLSKWNEPFKFAEHEQYPLIRKIPLFSQCVPKRVMRLARSRL